MGVFKMRKIIAALLIIVVATVAFAACEQKTDEVVSLTLGSMPTLSASIYAVGIEKGFFEENNIEVDLTIFRSAPERDAAATAGQLDGFMTDIMGLVNLVDGGFDFKITSYEYENFAIMANAQSNLTNPEDINKHTLGYSENTVIEFIVDTLIDSSKVQKVHMVKIPDRLAAVLGNELNMGVFPEPLISVIKANSGTVIASSVDFDIQPVVFAFSEDATVNKEKAVKSFYKAYNEIVDYMKSTDYAEYKEVLVKYSLATQDNVDRIKLPIDKFSHAQMPIEKDFDMVIKWMNDKGLIEKEYNLDEVSTDIFIVE
jgi:NitT/TauT family transport system substrate-binding protein